MTNRTFTQFEGEAGIALQGVPASPVPAASGALIIPFPALTPPPWAGEEEDAGCWESIGVLSVRLVGQFERPRILVWSAPEGPREEEPNPPEL